MKNILSKIKYEGRIPKKELKTYHDVLISGIDEIRYMEEHLLDHYVLPG